MPHRLDVPSSDRSGGVQVKANKQDLRYLGFECNNDGGREFDFSITTLGHVTKVVSVEVPALFFVGADRISFQEGPGICYAKLKRDTDTGRGAVLADVVGGEWKTISRTRLEPAPCFTGPITAGQKCHNFRRAEAGPKSGGSHESQGRCPQC